MSTNLEIETKCIITKENYLYLLNEYKNAKTYKQVNYYIGSEELLGKIKQFGLRIRKKNRKYELTLKVTEKIGKREINQDISLKKYAKLKYFGVFPDGEVKEYLTTNNVCDVSKLHIIGHLTTYRTDLNFYTSQISIDKSKYNGITDYEIESECETPMGAINDLAAFLEHNKIEYKKSEHNKLARFLKTRN